MFFDVPQPSPSSKSRPIRDRICSAAISVKVRTNMFRTSGHIFLSDTISTHRPDSTAVFPVPADALTRPWSASRPSHRPPSPLLWYRPRGRTFELALLDKGKEILDQLGPEQKLFVLISRPASAGVNSKPSLSDLAKQSIAYTGGMWYTQAATAGNW